MALRPKRQRSSAAPIIAKGVLYPLQNLCASKSATHGFASKSATHPNRQATRNEWLFYFGTKSPLQSSVFYATINKNPFEVNL